MMVKFVRLVLLVFTILSIAVFTVSNFLSKSDAVNAKSYILEAWGMPLVIEKFRKSICIANAKMFVVGAKYLATPKTETRYSYQYNANEEQFKLYELSYLAPPQKMLDNHRYPANIRLLCSGQSAFGIDPLFFAKINDTVIWRWVSDSMQWLNFPVNDSISQLAMGFVNDLGYKKGDRMAFLRQICFDAACYMVNDTTFEILAGVDRSKVFHNVFESDAQMASHYLQQLGVSASGIEEISFMVEGRNRTLQAAKACKNEMVSNHPNVKSFNIVTADIHSRRSYLVYKRVFGSDYTIGIVPIGYQNLNEGTKPRENIKMKLEESISLIASWLLPRWFYR